MTRRGPILSAAALLLVAAILTAIFFRVHGRLKAEEMEMGTLVQKDTIAHRELSQLRQLEAQTNARVHESAAVRAPVAAKSGEDAVKLAARREAILRSWVPLAYQRFFRSANLTIAQQRAFADALVAHWLRWADVVDVAREQGIQQNDPTWRELWRPENALYQEDVHRAIGTAAAQALQQYQRMSGPQQVADSVAGMVFDSSEPLNASQAAALKQILAGASSTYQKGGAADVRTINQAAAVRQAKEVLSPIQVAALQSALSSTPSIVQLIKLLKAATAKQGEAPSAAITQR